MSKKTKQKKNYLKIGLRSDKKLKASFYSFLYEKHFDWAIILAAFIAPLPYIASDNYVVLLLKILIYSILFYLSISYILNWRKLQEYYKVYNNTLEKSRSLIDKEKLKKRELDGIDEFGKNLLLELEELGKSYKEDSDAQNFKEYIEKHPEKVKAIDAVLNYDRKLTKTFVGIAASAITVLIHLSGIPRNELSNYRKILSIITFIILFFIVYNIELSFF